MRAGLLRDAFIAGASAALAVAAGVAAPSAVGAQTFPRERAFVYGVTNYDGRLYESTLAPPSVNTVYLLAGRTNVLAPRNTLVYYWPVTNLYQADWDQLNELVDGVLEVSRGGRAVQTLALSDYVVQYDVRSPQDSLRMYVGAEARAKFTEWEARQTTYRSALEAYFTASRRWNEQIAQLRQQQPGGVIPPNLMPPEPAEPEQPSLLSSSPARGFLIELPAGRYDIRVVRADGQTQHDSAKSLVVFDTLSDGTSYSVMPQTRWNLPETSDDGSQVIYAQKGATLYLQPFRAGQFDDLSYARMLNPQDQAARPGRARWVAFDPSPAARMIVRRPGEPPAEQPPTLFYVRQNPGGGLGYEVLAFDPATMDQPSFAGFEVKLTGDDVEVELVDAGGAAVAGSRRRLSALNAELIWAPYALSAIPLAAGAIAVLTRRRAARSIRVKE